MAEKIDSKNPYNVFEAGGHQLYHRMRAEDPVHCAVGPVTGNNFWWITRYDDCSALVRDLRIGDDRNRLPAHLQARWGDRMGEAFGLGEHLLNHEPPDHTRLRSLVHKAFTPRIIRNTQPRIQEICDNLLDQMAENDSADIIADYAGILPAMVIADLLGVPKEDQDKFRDWTTRIIFGWENYQDQIVAGMEFAQYMHAQIDRRATEKPDDVLTGLVDAEEAGDKLNRQELMSMIFLLLAAGHETTTHLIGNGMVALFKFPEQMQLLKDNLDNADLIANMVEEILRYDGPAPSSLIRYVYEDFEFRGKTINQGDGVNIVYHAANRDPEVFENPDQFDIQRENANKHMDFGGGIHYCLGAPLARLEGSIAIPSLVKRFPDMALATTQLEYDTQSFHGFKAIPVRLNQ